MAMQNVEKALDTVVGANLMRQDLSATISLTDGRPRPFLQYAPHKARAKQLVHEWDEQGLIGPGNGVASYADGSVPTADAQAANQRSNVTCRIGKTATVTDDMVAAFTGGGQWVLADGELEKQVTQAIEFQTELKTRETLDEIEWMHISGDASITAGFPGGQTDGLMKWTLNNAKVLTPSGATSGAPVAFAEPMIKDLFRQIAETFPSVMPDTCLIPPELKPDFNSFVGSGAGNPITRIISNNTATMDMIAGNPEVTKYDTGFGVVDVRIEPNLSPIYNPLLSGNLYVTPLFYNKGVIDDAPLRPLGAEQLARINTSVQRMITTTTAQEHRIAKHAGAIQYVKSGIA